ncbi:MAG: uracil-DNA glycosylase [Anaerolineales bacterium]
MIKIDDCVACQTFPCKDVNHQGYLIPDLTIDPLKIKLVMISESVPLDSDDYFYAGNEAAYALTTIQAFSQAGIRVKSIQDLQDLGIYFTTAIKCVKTNYVIKAETIKHCSEILARELGLFSNLLAILLMGDAAIKAINAIARKTIGQRAIPAGSTYKIRSEEYYYQDMRLFPSYLQVGPSFGIEKSKQRMITEDISAAMAII